MHAARGAAGRHDGALALGMMHVLIAEDLIDRDYIGKYTVGFDALEERACANIRRNASRRSAASPPRRWFSLRAIRTLAPAAIRLNYGMQRHAGGGIAARTIACLAGPGGAWREAARRHRPHHGRLFRLRPTPSSRAARSPRGRRAARHNQSQLGDALRARSAPVRALIVTTTSGRGLPRLGEGDRRLLARRPVHGGDGPLSDRHADYADIVLRRPRSSSTSDVHKAYGHLYLLANNPAIAPVGESLPNSSCPAARRANGFDEPCFRDSDEDFATALASKSPRMPGHRLARAEGKGLAEARRAGALRALRRRRFRRFRQVRALQRSLEKQGIDPLPFYNPPAEAADESLARRYPLAFLSPPARHFLNSSFATSRAFASSSASRISTCTRRCRAGAASETAIGARLQRSRRVCAARPDQRQAAPGRGVAPSVWWKKYSPDGRNANDVTSQAHDRSWRSARSILLFDCRVRSIQSDRAAAKIGPCAAR